MAYLSHFICFSLSKKVKVAMRLVVGPFENQMWHQHSLLFMLVTAGMTIAVSFLQIHASVIGLFNSLSRMSFISYHFALLMTWAMRQLSWLKIEVQLLKLVN